MSGMRGIAMALLFAAGVPCWSAEPSSASSPGPDSGGAEQVSVLFLTNRHRVAGQLPADTFTGARGQDRFGRCRVAFAPIPVINHVAKKVPFYVQGETRELSFLQALAEESFWQELDVARRETVSGSVVLYVHGYNYSFERTCKMAAALQRRLAGEAAVLMFSWPSNGLPSDYVQDLADVEWSVPVLAGLLRELADRVGPEAVQLVAHSLGTRGVLQSLQRLVATGSKEPLMDRLVLLAPDFDSQTFTGVYPEIKALVSHMTLYASSNDTPLMFSRQLSGYPRLGEGGEHLTVVQGIETIDVSSLGRYQVTGHEYFYFHPVVSADLVTLLGSGTRAQDRPGLEGRKRNGTRYWVFRGEHGSE